MKPNLGDRARLTHMLEAIGYIESFLVGYDFDDFEQSVLHRSAVERQLEIIGEAATAISETVKLAHPEVDWQPIKRFRNVIVHEYFGVSRQIVWGVVRKELPVLKAQLLVILQDSSLFPDETVS